MISTIPLSSSRGIARWTGQSSGSMSIFPLLKFRDKARVSDSSALLWRQQLWWHPLFIILINARPTRALHILSKANTTSHFSHTNPQTLARVLFASPSHFSTLKYSLFGITGAQNDPAAQCIYISSNFIHPPVVAYVAAFSSLQYSYSQPVTIATIAYLP